MKTTRIEYLKITASEYEVKTSTGEKQCVNIKIDTIDNKN
jgi:hypothetical protein